MATIAGRGAFAIKCARFLKPIARRFSSITARPRTLSRSHNSAGRFTACFATGVNGKLDLGAAADVIARYRDVHSPKPRVISITQATELGTVYTPNELEATAAFAKEHALFVHMDGARFANAVASLGCKPKEITWQRGVDVLAFG